MRKPAEPERGKNGRPQQALSWPEALRGVRSWLAPFRYLTHCWKAWAGAPPPPELAALLDERQQVDAAGELVARYLHGGGDADRLLAVMGRLLLREDRNFHTIQAVEAAFSQHALLRGTAAGAHVLVAAARYLAAHSPTMRSQEQTYDIARRLSRGEILYEG